MTASPRAPRPAGAWPKADAPSLGESASCVWPPSEVPLGLCQCVCLGSDAILSPLSVFRLLFLCHSLCVSLSLSLPPCVCVCVRVRARVCLSVCISFSLSWSLSLNLRLFLPLSLLTPGAHPFLWPRPLTGAMALADELAPAGCLLSVCLSVCLPVAHLLSQEGRVLGGLCGGKGGLGRAKGQG